MSGATLLRMSVPAGPAFDDDFAQRRPFGKRRVWTDPAAEGPRSVDRGVADMRQRIGATPSALPARLPWALGGGMIVAVSVVLWLDLFQVATLLARELSQVF